MSSGLYAALLSQARALNIHQTSIEVAGRNISHVNDPNYAKQKVTITSDTVIRTSDGSQNLGIKIDSISQNRDNFLDYQIVKDIFRLSNYEYQEKYGSMIELAIGDKLDQSTQAAATDNEPDKVVGSAGIGAAITRFFNALNGLAAAPDEISCKNKVYSEAENLITQFHTVSTRLSDLSTELDSEIDTQVSNINTILSQIAEVNEDIDRFEVADEGSALELRDKRQELLEELAGYINFYKSEDSDGNLQLNIYDSDGNEVTLVDHRRVMNEVNYDSTRTASDSYAFYIGNPGDETWLDVSGGSTFGTWTTKTGILSDFSTNMDTLASNLVSEINTVYNGAVSGNDFFDSTGTTAATIAFDSTMTGGSAIEPGSTASEGNNDIATALYELSSTDISGLGNKTFGDYYTEKLTDAANTINDAKQKKANQQVLKDMLVNRRQAYSGVSLNEEMTDLMRYQRAFQASSRVLSIMNSLLEALVNIGR